jgi:predicted amidohydrolase YtcJ
LRTLYRASNVRTLAYPQIAGWVLVDGRHVQRAGSGEPPQADRTVDLPGATIVPGMIDTHVHLTGTGLALDNAEVEQVRSAQELLGVARNRATDGEGVVFLQGFDETAWTDPRLPTARELDAAVDRPMVIRRADGHVALANEAAIRQAGIVDVPGLDRAPGEALAGVLTQEANSLLCRWAQQSFTEHQIQDLQLRAAGLAASRGVTTVHEMSMPHDTGERDLAVFLEQRADLPVDTMIVVASMDVGRMIELGMGSVGGDLPVDGSIGARTAAVRAPFADGGGDGALYHDADQLAEFFTGGHAAGLQVGVHAVGDRAIDQVLTVWERVYQALDSRERRHFRARRHRIEHFSMATAHEIERAAMLGLAASIQPTFDLIWGRPGGLYETRLGRDRAASMHAIRTMLERGIEVGAGSDSPVVPLDPWKTVHALETLHDPTQRLSRFEAIRLHTLGSARLGYHDEKKGAIAPGFHADLVAYDADPFEVDDVLALAPVLTVSMGREVFAA